jgi:predicted nucleic-acid-binding protein
VIAVDTNILVRLITGDDEDQADMAVSLAKRETLFVSLTVIIETEWVLRSRFGYDRAAICNAFDALPQAADVVYQDDLGVVWALKRYAAGGELADYIHMVASAMIGRFATFEKKLVTRAGDEAPVAIETLG